MQKSLNEHIDDIVKHMFESFNNGDDVIIFICARRWGKAEIARRFMETVGLGNYKEKHFALLPSNTVIVCKQTEIHQKSFDDFLKDSSFKKLDIDNEQIQFWIRRINKELATETHKSFDDTIDYDNQQIVDLVSSRDKSNKTVFRCIDNNLLRQQKRWRDRYNRYIKK